MATSTIESICSAFPVLLSYVAVTYRHIAFTLGVPLDQLRCQTTLVIENIDYINEHKLMGTLNTPDTYQPIKLE